MCQARQPGVITVVQCSAPNKAQATCARGRPLPTARLLRRRGVGRQRRRRRAVLRPAQRLRLAAPGGVCAPQLRRLLQLGGGHQKGGGGAQHPQAGVPAGKRQAGRSYVEGEAGRMKPGRSELAGRCPPPLTLASRCPRSARRGSQYGAAGVDCSTAQQSFGKAWKKALTGPPPGRAAAPHPPPRPLAPPAAQPS